jgi:pyridoxine 5-phosphate synthase
MAKLSVNVNKIATLRNTRPPSVGIPDVARLARICLEAGAHGITVHPRPDQRHIRPDDVGQLAALVRGYPGAEYNIEGNPFLTYLEYARAVHPTQCTLVPDSHDAATSDHGWDVRKEMERLKPLVAELHACGARVSLFMDPDPEAIAPAAQTGADRVELYTAPYAEAFKKGERGIVTRYAQAAQRAHQLRLGVNAGHDLNLDNLPFFLSSVPHVEEVSIGHALIADALEFGLAQTVRKYLAAVAGDAAATLP